MFQKKAHTKDPEKKGHDHILAAAIMQKKNWRPKNQQFQQKKYTLSQPRRFNS